MNFGAHIEVIVVKSPPRKCINIVFIVDLCEVFLSEPGNENGCGGGTAGDGGERQT